VEDVGLMDEKVLEMGRELRELREKESKMREKLQAENRWLS